MTRSEKIIIGIGVMIDVAIIGGITFAFWQYRRNSEFTKYFECQKFGKYYYYNPATNECYDIRELQTNEIRRYWER